MKNIWMVLALMLACGAAATAQSSAKGQELIPIVIHYEMRQISNSEYRALRGKSFVGAKAPGKLLQSSGLVTSTGAEALIHFGGKYPLVWYSPKRQQFQVQYVDVGQKLDVRCFQQPNGTYRLEARSEFSVADGVKSGKAAEGDEIISYPSTVVFITENALVNLKLGQTAILGRSKGSEVVRVWNAQGVKNAEPNLLATIRLEALK